MGTKMFFPTVIQKKNRFYFEAVEKNGVQNQNSEGIRCFHQNSVGFIKNQSVLGR